MKYISPLLALSVLAACSGGSESTRIDVEVTTAALDTQTATTDLGYQVTLSSARLAASDILFTTGGGEESLASRVWSWIVPSAHAHPGHFGGGEVAGELLGDYLLDWQSSESNLGTAIMLTGPYTGVDFLLRRSTGGELGDPSYDGHSVYLTGVASKGESSYPFDALVRFADGTAVIGAYLDAELAEDSSGHLSIGLQIIDPFEGDTLFDGIDFELLAGDDGSVEIRPGSPEHNRLDRLLQSHDHYLIQLSE